MFSSGGGSFGPIGGAAGPATATSSPVFQLAREQAAPFWAQGGSMSTNTLIIVGLIGLVLILVWKFL